MSTSCRDQSRSPSPHEPADVNAAEGVEDRDVVGSEMVWKPKIVGSRDLRFTCVSEATERTSKHALDTRDTRRPDLPRAMLRVKLQDDTGLLGHRE